MQIVFGRYIVIKVSSWLRQDRRGRADFLKRRMQKAESFESNRPCDPTDDPQKSAFQSVSEDCQRERSQRTTLPATLLTTLKNRDFRCV